MDVDCLPPELLVLVFSFAAEDVSAVACLRCVCRRWRDVVDENDAVWLAVARFRSLQSSSCRVGTGCFSNRGNRSVEFLSPRFVLFEGSWRMRLHMLAVRERSFASWLAASVPRPARAHALAAASQALSAPVPQRSASACSTTLLCDSAIGLEGIDGFDGERFVSWTRTGEFSLWARGLEASAFARHSVSSGELPLYWVDWNYSGGSLLVVGEGASMPDDPDPVAYAVSLWDAERRTEPHTIIRSSGDLDAIVCKWSVGRALVAVLCSNGVLDLYDTRAPQAAIGREHFAMPDDFDGHLNMIERGEHELIITGFGITLFDLRRNDRPLDMRLIDDFVISTQALCPWDNSRMAIGRFVPINSIVCSAPRRGS